MGHAADWVATVVPELGASAPDPVSVPRDGEQRFALFDGMTLLFQRASEVRPPLPILDDLQARSPAALFRVPRVELVALRWSPF